MSLEQKKGGKIGLLSALLREHSSLTFLVADKRVFGNQIISIATMKYTKKQPLTIMAKGCFFRRFLDSGHNGCSLCHIAPI